MVLASPCTSAGSPSISTETVQPASDQIARGYQAVTAVISFAAEHHDVPAVRQFAQDKASHGASGVLHQFERRDPEAFGGDPIGCAHLISGQYLHLISIVEHSCCSDLNRDLLCLEMLKGLGEAGGFAVCLLASELDGRLERSARTIKCLPRKVLFSCFGGRKRSYSMGKISTPGVLRLRASSAVSHDKSVTRSAQDDDFVGILKKNIPNRLVLMGRSSGYAVIN